MRMRSLARGLILSVGMGTLAPPAAAGSALPVRELGPGIFLHQGAHEETSAGNEGAIANIGFIIGQRCVAVIDSGGSLENGQRLRKAIRQRTSKPVCHVINTHVHPDHVFGNAAFVADQPEFIGHEHLAASMQARGEHYRKSLSRALGKSVASMPAMIVPTRALASEMTIDLGGRLLLLRAWPTAHTNTDVTVLDQNTGTLWLGDLLFERRVPSLDGSLKGWLSVMDSLRAMPARQVVPGHGPPSTDWPGVMRDQERYLQALLDEVRQAIRDRKTLEQTVNAAAAQERPRWLLFDAYHARNVTTAYTELEWEN